MNIKTPMKWLSGLLALLLLTGCQPEKAATDDMMPAQTEKPEQFVYASFYPVYALSELLLRDIPDMELRQLVQPQDGCLRSYSLSDWDLYQIAFNADAVLLGGRGLESFETAMQSLGEDGPAVVRLFQNLPLDNNGKQAVDEDSGHLNSENPHLYLSARSLPDILENLCAYMMELDPMYADRYQQNLKAAQAQANALIAEYNAVEIDRERRVALLNEALIYPANDLGLNIVCRIERENGAYMYGTELENTVYALMENQVSVVLIENQAPDTLCRALTEHGFTVVKMDILSTGRADMGAKGYFAAMRSNLSAIQSALSK